ncbi:MAG TPA: hypothetical protein VLE53_12875 [Gemmatimonadaceae bacterium]|nr:hypothetical protein [Gemmatimonadaceae bacterium]
MRTPTLIAAAALVLAAPLQAQHEHPTLHVNPAYRECHVRFAPNLTQSAFGRFVREFGTVSAYKQMAPASTLGRGNVSVGIEMMSFQIDHWSDAWNDTFAHPDEHHELGARQEFPKVKLRVGVTDDIDVGAFFTRNPLSNYGWVGVDGKYRLLSEEENKPVTLAVRGAYTKTLYVTDMDMHALTADVSVERRFGRLFRPYVGLGADAVYARETSDVVNLRTERSVVPHVLGGLDVTLGRVTLGAEYTVGARSSMQVQVGALVF